MVDVVPSVFIGPGRQRSSILDDVQTKATKSLDRNALGVLMPRLRGSDDVEIMRLDWIQYIVSPLVDGADVKNAEMELALVGDCVTLHALVEKVSVSAQVLAARR